MISQNQRIEIRNRLTSTFREEIMKDVFHGLTAPQKYLPCKYFYDIRGSHLFEEICCLPEYYPTRTEISILKHAAPRIMDSFERGDIVELGSGANRKIKMLLDSVSPAKFQYIRYIPVDVNESALVSASEELLKIYPELKVFGIVADVTYHMDEIPRDRPRLIIFLGSTIGNFNEKARERFLRLISDSMKPDDRFLVGFDLLKPKATLEAAYNDSRGITSEFNKNVLHVLNRELKADFDPSNFDHIAFFNEKKERVEMHLQAKRRVTLNINDLDMVVEISKDETIHTEICGKFSKAGIERMVNNAGLAIKQWFFDSKEWFSLVEVIKDIQ
jgi:L-histidine N-alpha-methyltransferase